jgi:hypothetical protein
MPLVPQTSNVIEQRPVIGANVRQFHVLGDLFKLLMGCEEYGEFICGFHSWHGVMLN